MKIDAIKLRKLRLRAGFRYQSRVAEILGITRNAVCQWERGQSSPQRKTLKALATLYKCNITDFCESDSDESRESVNHPESVVNHSVLEDMNLIKATHSIQNLVKIRDDALSFVLSLNKQIESHFNYAA
jgi:transcriptional regulator with XRE-family HTH domain